MDISLSEIAVRQGTPARRLFSIPKLEIKRGSQVLIEGPSGYGKTTLLHLIAGLMPIQSGKIMIGENDIGSMNDTKVSAFRRAHIGLVFQKLNLLDHLTPLENILLTLPATKDREEIARAALHETNVAHLANARTAQLSLGEQQRVAVARVVAHRPAVVLADEPTSSLDAGNADAVIQALQGLGKQTTLIVVSHDQRLKSCFKQVLDFTQWVNA